MTIALLILLLLIGVGGATWVFVRGNQMHWLFRTFVALLPISGAFLIFTMWGIIVASPLLAWNSVRLTPTVAMTKGLPIYPDPNTGAMVGDVDGPLAVLWVLPAAIARTPSNAISIAVSIVFATLAIPMFWIGLESVGKAINARAIAVAFAASVAGLWIIIDDDLLRTISFTIGGEAISTGLILTSIALLINRRASWCIYASAIFVALAVVARPATLPVLLVGPAGLWLMERNRDAVIQLFTSLAATLLAILICVGAFGFDRLWFYCITLPLHPAWSNMAAIGKQSSALDALTRSAFANLSLLWPMLALAGVLALAHRTLRESEATPIDDELFAEPSLVNRSDTAWIMLPLAALAVWPASVWSGARLSAPGGSTCVSELFIIATIIALIGRLAKFTPQIQHASIAYVSPSWALIAASAITLWFAPKTSLSKHRIEQTVSEIAFHHFDNPQEIAFHFETAQPGRVYFPWCPLPVLMASGKEFHDEPSLMNRLALHDGDRGLSGVSIRAHLPEQLAAVGFPQVAPANRTLQFISKPVGPVNASELPTFAIFWQIDITHFDMPAVPPAPQPPQ